MSLSYTLTNDEHGPGGGNVIGHTFDLPALGRTMIILGLRWRRSSVICMAVFEGS